MKSPGSCHELATGSLTACESSWGPEETLGVLLGAPGGSNWRELLKEAPFRVLRRREGAQVR
jgi:hypothetical protein